MQVLNVSNPSQRPLVIQPVLLQHYTKPRSIVDMLTEELDPDLDQYDLTGPHSSSFSFSQEHVSYNTVSSLSNAVLQPDDHYQITVAFSPSVDSVSSTLLLIRNNLTVFDYMVLRGRGVQGVFSIDGIQPSSDPLLFEFTQSMMEKCHGEGREEGGEGGGRKGREGGRRGRRGGREGGWERGWVGGRREGGRGEEVNE